MVKYFYKSKKIGFKCKFCRFETINCLWRVINE